MNQPTKQTPLEKLLADKELIRQQCRQQEQKLNEAFMYIQENTGSLLLSGLSALLFSGSSASKKAKALPASGNAPTVSLGFADVLSIGKSMMPVIWEIAQPMIITWCIKKVQKIIVQTFQSSKKTKT
jgi:hypothetical protein